MNANGPGTIIRDKRKGRYAMSLGFFPSRESIYKEVQQWIATNKLEMLLGLCNCCTYKAVGHMASHQCRSCSVRAGIAKLVRVEREPVADEELLGVC